MFSSKKIKYTGFPVLLFLFLAFSACIPRKWSAGPSLKEKENLIKFYAINHGIHFSLALPAQSPVHDWRRKFPELPRGKYLEVAWGDADYYQSEKFSSLTGAKALLLPTSSVMHVVSFNRDPNSYIRKVHPLQTDTVHFKRMIDFVEGSFYRTDTGKYKYLQSGLYGSSGFYKSTKTYHAVYNCNNWVSSALHKAGMQTPLWGGIPFFIEIYL